jgi:hypothetical protein
MVFTITMNVMMQAFSDPHEREPKRGEASKIIIDLSPFHSPTQLLLLPHSLA